MAPAHRGLPHPCLDLAYWNGMAEFDDAAIADPDRYCRGGFFVLVDGGQSTPVPFVAGDQ